jgi:hypothetical protein
MRAHSPKFLPDDDATDVGERAIPEYYCIEFRRGQRVLQLFFRRRNHTIAVLCISLRPLRAVREGARERIKFDEPTLFKQKQVGRIEFPSRAAAEDWYKSPAYQKIIALRLDSTVGDLIIVDGIG